MYTKRILLSFFSLLLIISCESEMDVVKTDVEDAAVLHNAVDEDTAIKTAINWMKLRFPERDRIAVEQVETELQGGEVASYRISLEDGGFVIVAADYGVKPVMAYSNTGSLTGEDEGVDRLVDGYVSTLNNAAVTDETAEQNEERWSNIGSPSKDTKFYLRNSTPVVAPLIQTKWSQSGGYKPNFTYNKFTPFVNDAQTERAPVGCAAVAFGQMLKYYDYPKRGLSSNSYCNSGDSVSSCSEQNLVEADFSNRYDWAHMPASLSSLSAQEDVDAVATLLYHIGAALGVRYGAHGTNAQLENPSVFKAFRKHFRMVDVEQVSRSSYTSEEWTALIQNELQHQRPVILSGYDSRIGAGHAYILDGLDNDGNAHVNWGWGGSANGYYDISTLLISHPSAGKLSFTEDLIAFINFTPNIAEEGDRCNGPEGLRCKDNLVCALGGNPKNTLDEISSDEYGTCLDPNMEVPEIPEELEEVTETFDGTVEKSQWVHFGPFASFEGIAVSMLGTGDADLYVKKGAQPTAKDFDCRPYKSGSNESCNLEGAGDFFVSVSGYAQTSDFDLTVVFKQ